MIVNAIDDEVPPRARPRRRRRWLIAAAALVLLGAAGGIVAALWPSGSLSWQTVTATGLPDDIESLDSISCPSADECWMMGLADGGDRTVVIHLKDGVLTPLDLPESYQPSSVACRATDDCWANDPFANRYGEPSESAYHYDGHAWKLVQFDRGSDGALAATGGITCNSRICVSGTASCDQLDAAVWDGTAWHRATPSTEPAGCADAITCTGVNACLGFSVVNDQLYRVVGGAWQMSRLTGLPRLGEVVMPQCVTADDCIVLVASGEGAGRAEIGRLTDGRWSIEEAQNGNLDRGIYALNLACTSATNCVIVGARNTSSRRNARDTAGIWQWDGSQWQAVETGVTGREVVLFGISCPSSGTCWATGERDGKALLMHGTS